MNLSWKLLQQCPKSICMYLRWASWLFALQNCKRAAMLNMDTVIVLDETVQKWTSDSVRNLKANIALKYIAAKFHIYIFANIIIFCDWGDESGRMIRFSITRYTLLVFSRCIPKSIDKKRVQKPCNLCQGKIKTTAVSEAPSLKVNCKTQFELFSLGTTCCSISNSTKSNFNEAINK